MLETDFERVSLKLETPFTIARGTTTETENVVVYIEDDEGNVGIGGAAPSSHYGENVETVLSVLPSLLEVVEEVGDPHQLERIERKMKKQVRGNPAARCSVSIALHDLVSKRLGLPLYRYWGLDPSDSVETSYTIGIDDTEKMVGKAERASDEFSILKVKLGTDRDLEIVESIRDAVPSVDIYVDANEDWKPKEAVEKIEALSKLDVEFVEQPVRAENPEGMKFVYENSSLPIAADESCVTIEDVPRIADRTDIANIKLMKCGGLIEARRMIHAAQAHSLDVMLGCMTETNASIAAGCHLTPLLDYADLDGSLLLDEDPYEGVPMPEIDLEKVDSGTGAALK